MKFAWYTIPPPQIHEADQKKMPSKIYYNGEKFQSPPVQPSSTNQARICFFQQSQQINSSILNIVLACLLRGCNFPNFFDLSKHMNETFFYSVTCNQ
ncbi:hypothetical protein FGO68_gene7688 [Halteria grandinella]|uniref:Uncharacterized protein n=1 Tax=Halteria grandinella TaxID=5974 RepID=A0A8J8NXA2_HALGN|nr:hypothetical protein FGO68_gene7688 [Halteria grandinella]